MEGLSVFVYLISAIGLSFFLDFFVKFKANGVEQFAMRLGIGTAAFTLLGVILDLLFIPLNIWIFVGIGVCLFVWHVYKGVFDVQTLLHIPGLKEKIYTGLVVVMFIVTAFMYTSGSFSYPYLEDGDPWSYLAVSNVISDSQTIKAPFKYEAYSEPYTQGYQIWLGMLHQTNDNMMWTMKFFHNIWISLSMLFLFFFVRQLFRKTKSGLDVAFFSTVMLFAIPSWLTHFLFSLSFNFTLILVFLYTLAKIDEDKAWKWIAAVVYGSLLINHLYSAGIATVIFLTYFFISVLSEKKINPHLVLSGVVGLALSLTFFIPTLMRHATFISTDTSNLRGTGGLNRTLLPFINFVQDNVVLGILVLILIGAVVYALLKPDKWFAPVSKVLRRKYVSESILAVWWLTFIPFFFLFPKQILEMRGTADAVYSLSHFIKADSMLINNTTGWGPVISLLVIAGLLAIVILRKNLFKQKYFPYLFIGNAFILFLILVFGVDQAIQLMPFRVWTVLAIFTSIIAGSGMVTIVNSFKGNLKLIVIVLLVALVLWTSFVPKYAHNTNPNWPEHVIMHPQAYPVYEYVRTNLQDEVVLNLCRRSTYLYAYNANPPLVNAEFNENRLYQGAGQDVLHLEFFNRDLTDTHQLLKEQGVDYVVLGASCIRGDTSKVPLVQQKIEEMANATDMFSYRYGTQVELLFSVR